MARAILRLGLTLFLVAAISAQKQIKPWSDWTKSDVERILNDSPWGQTQIDTDTSEMVYTPTTITGGGDSASRREQGATNQATSVKFRIRWLSAKPIREALVRQEQLTTGKVSDQLRFFAEGPSYTRIVIAVTFEASDQRFGAKVMQAFRSANLGVLKNSTYLELKDGKRIFLQQYVAPQDNILGAAMFVFPRNAEGRPLLTADALSVRFHSEYENKAALDSALNPPGQVSNPRQPVISNSRVANQGESPIKFKLDMKFKVPDMVYHGELEY
jgi:hypothetical protein